MIGLRKFNKAVSIATTVLVGRDTARDLKRSTNKLLGIKRRGKNIQKK
jgi:hypothetical protein